jgi:xanthine dehydrogenase FAD-binding subunit
MSPGVYCPSELGQLWSLLEDGAEVMAGGTDLLVRRRSSGVARDIVCLERIAELRQIRDEGGRMRLGACATHTQLLRSPLVRARVPVLAQALDVLGSPLVRNMGTLGGNIVTASPAGDTLPPLYALDAQVELTSRDGVRVLPLCEFITGPGASRLKQGEIVSAVLVAPPAEGFLHHFEKVGGRKALAIAVVSLAALLRTGPGGMVEEARIALGSVSPTVVRCRQAESLLIGRPLSEESLRLAAECVRGEVSPIGDLRATAEYRRQVAGNLLLRLVSAAN